MYIPSTLLGVLPRDCRGTTSRPFIFIGLLLVEAFQEGREREKKRRRTKKRRKRKKKKKKREKYVAKKTT